MNAGTGTHPTACLVATLSVIAAGGCRHWSSTPVASTDRSPAPLVASWLDSLHSEERQFRELAQDVPSHGGYYLDLASGNLVLYLTNLHDSAAGIRLVRSRLAGDLGKHPHAKIVVRQATYTWLQLREWRDRLLLGKLFSLPGAVSLDLDEEQNRIVIGIDSTADSSSVRNLAGRLGIPQTAVELEESGPLEQFDGTWFRTPDDTAGHRRSRP